MQFSRETLYLITLLSIYRTTWSQNPCYDSSYVQPGLQYRINNPNFPYQYPAGMNCTWYLSTMNGYRVKMSCNYVTMPKIGSNCYDILAISTTGDISDATVYCTPFTAQASVLVLQLISYPRSWGGIFSCDITTELSQSITPNRTVNCACGWSFSTRIVGGKTTGVNEFPSMALIVNVPRRSQWCGATIISQRSAVTAAHCFENDRNPANFGLLIGEHNITTRVETNATRLLKVRSILVHDRPMIKEGGNDIAILVTFEYIQYSSRVGPACLPFNLQKDDIMRQYVIVTGWGTLEFGGSLTDVLQKVRLQIVPDTRCETVYKSMFNPMQHLCTYSAGKDACQYDSGGPLYYYNYLNNRFTLVGIVSFGVQCANQDPAVNIYVHYYLPWILEMLPG